MDIPINAEVFATDGLAGRSTAVIIDAASRKVTHLVVKEHSFPHLEHLVPIERVTSTTPDSINLSTSHADLVELAPFHYSDYVPSDMSYEPYSAEQYYSALYLNPGPALLPDHMVLSVAYDHVPSGELVVHTGGRVNARDGYVGQIDEFLVDPRDGHITHLVLRKGHLWGQREVTIPVSEIDRLEDEHVYLRLDKHAVESLPWGPGHQYSA